MPPIIETLIDRPGRFIGSLVESRPAYRPKQRWERPALLALLLIAAIVRFWGVGSFSLHKPDEDTTALPAVHILVDGTPRFPSGMFYARAIAQSYLVAGSVKVFGQTEWALRLPSVLCGLLVVLLSYYLGRRFLEPPWNMAFVAVVALLPGMIADSQEVRMYGFLTASLAAYMILLFRWERTGRTTALVAAVFAMLVAIQFQEIAFFSALLVLFPGLASGDAHKLRQGIIAGAVMAVGYLAISTWQGSFYPIEFKVPADPGTQLGLAPSAGAARFRIFILVPAIAAALGIAWLNVRNMRGRALATLAGALLIIGMLLQALMFYHLAALFMLAGLVIARRGGGGRAPGYVALIVASALLAVTQILMLHNAGAESLRKVLGVMVGQPSIWPYLQVAEYSPIAMLLAVAALLAGFRRIANGGRPSDDVLFAFLGIFAPLFAMGFFGWYIPPRYGEFALLPMLLCALAFAQQFMSSPAIANAVRNDASTVLASMLAVAAIVNPRAVVASINAGSSFADHRGAAEFMRSIVVGPRDIVLAEEVLMQTYYLGHVDYWLTGPHNSAGFLIKRHGQLVDEYTATPLIGTGAELRALVDRTDRGTIYVIGSGEGQQDGRLYMRGPEIQALLHSVNFTPVFVARDGRTQVWKVAPPAVPAIRTN